MLLVGFGLIAVEIQMNNNDLTYIYVALEFPVRFPHVILFLILLTR